ncbi:MAG: acyltransferase [Bacteroidetes bacterium]|jgi:acetyltransferase-like isoleucine patch superfamily enzyme|nr:acyltransferase [Bacteroidota bacterium]MBT3749631.1 acyltransferase [Bacteroidota bacterium]MBT4401043.1 acyltransferase [Bacteroidota bacterium]MBT4408591.1 acyltransferase [Bacteroidota bacterium]MBT5426491.1 acyltransferase [Bacteroidota bacterium]
MDIKERIKKNQKFRDFVMWTISPRRRPKPRLWIKLFVNPFVHKRGKHSKIRRISRMDLFPYKRFELGENSTVESFCVINNGAGDVILGSKVRVGIGSVIIGPVKMGNGSGLGQHVFLSGFNHGFSDGEKNSSKQDLDIRPVIIEDEAHIGANSVVLPGVTIGKRCQIGAGSVVTKDIPAFSVAVGNPARVIKTYNKKSGKWERVDI